MTYPWYETYRAALLETDWTHMQERLHAAESELRKRQHMLSLDHGGTPEEQLAIASALQGITHLKTEARNWQTRAGPQSGPP